MSKPIWALVIEMERPNAAGAAIYRVIKKIPTTLEEFVNLDRPLYEQNMYTQQQVMLFARDDEPPDPAPVKPQAEPTPEPKARYTIETRKGSK